MSLFAHASRSLASLRGSAVALAVLFAIPLAGATPAAAVDALLGLRPATQSVVEGDSLLVDLVLSLPSECRSVDVVLGLTLSVLPTVQGAGPEDFEEIVVDGQSFAGFPVALVIRKEAQRDRLVVRVEIVTADDTVREALEDVLLELALDPAIRASLFCERSDGSRIDLDLAFVSQRAPVAIEDDDSTRGGRTLAGPENAPRHPLIERGVTGLRLFVYEGLEGSAGGLFARLLDVDGDPVAPAQRVSTLPPGDAGFRPAITRLPDGGFYLVYVETGSLGERVVGRALGPDGLLGDVTVLAPFTMDVRGHVKAAADRLGRVTVTIEDALGLAEPLLLVVRPDGELVSSRTISIPNGAQLAKTPLGDTAVVFANDAGELVARVLSRDGALGPRVVVDSTGDPGRPVVVASSRGFVVVWAREVSDEVWARQLERDGTPKGDAFLVGRSPIAEGATATVATNSAGDFAIAWESDAAVRSADRSRLGAAAGTGSSIVSRTWNPQGEAASEESTAVESEEGADPSDPDVTLDDDDDVTIVFEREGPDGEPEEVAEVEIEETIAPGECSGDVEALCLTDERFEVRAIWDDGASAGGEATAAELTSDTGSFWFFDADNVELVVKVLDACSFNGAYWVFGAGLTDVAVELTVTDVLTGVTRTYFNALGAFQPIRDTSAFACEDDGAAAPGGEARTALEAEAHAKTLLEEKTLLEKEWSELAAALGQANGAPAGLERVDRAGESPLVLGDGRFEVEIDWSTASASGRGTPQVLTADTGVFWFFEPENLEVVVKVLDACSFSGNYWVFGGGLTDVEARVTITDTQTGAVREYTNDLDVPFQPIRDTSAFACE